MDPHRPGSNSTIPNSVSLKKQFMMVNECLWLESQFLLTFLAYYNSGCILESPLRLKAKRTYTESQAFPEV